MVSTADLIDGAALLLKFKKADQPNFFLAKCVQLIKFKKLLIFFRKVKWMILIFNFNIEGEAT